MKELLSALLLAVWVIGSIFFWFYYVAHTNISCKTQYRIVSEQETLPEEMQKWINEVWLQNNDIRGIYTIHIKPFFGRYADRQTDAIPFWFRGKVQLFGNSYPHFVFPPVIFDLPDNVQKSVFFPTKTEPFILGENMTFEHILYTKDTNTQFHPSYKVEYQTAYGKKKTKVCAFSAKN